MACAALARRRARDLSGERDEGDANAAPRTLSAGKR
ncbi:hypothetical protein FEP08_01237 [Burkholderia multivorans]|jgi:sodium/bile acid cotransporter 7|nr:hypothetical protein [Burkholderia multivorans]